MSAPRRKGVGTDVRRSREISGRYFGKRTGPENEKTASYWIVIEMYFGDHAPPHVHARYSSDEATIVIATGEIVDGSLPPGRYDWCENG